MSEVQDKPHKEKVGLIKSSGYAFLFSGYCLTISFFLVSPEGRGFGSMPGLWEALFSQKTLV